MCEEPQLGLRQDGSARRDWSGQSPRPTLQRKRRGRWILTGTVLITGGTWHAGWAGCAASGGAARGSASAVVLAQGRADALEQELVAAGACVRVAACDVSDRGALSELLSGIGAEHPLTAVIHTAGVIDDGVFDAMSGARIDKVFAPKVDAARASARADQGQGACCIRAVLLGLWGAGGCRSGQLRGGEYVPGCAGASSSGARAAGVLAGLGLLGPAQRPDRAPWGGGHGAHAPRRDGGAVERGRACAV